MIATGCSDRTSTLGARARKTHALQLFYIIEFLVITLCRFARRLVKLSVLLVHDLNNLRRLLRNYIIICLFEHGHKQVAGHYLSFPSVRAYAIVTGAEARRQHLFHYSTENVAIPSVMEFNNSCIKPS